MPGMPRVSERRGLKSSATSALGLRCIGSTAPSTACHGSDSGSQHWSGRSSMQSHNDAAMQLLQLFRVGSWGRQVPSHPTQRCLASLPQLPCLPAQDAAGGQSCRGASAASEKTPEEGYACVAWGAIAATAGLHLGTLPGMLEQCPAVSRTACCRYPSCNRLIKRAADLSLRRRCVHQSSFESLFRGAARPFCQPLLFHTLPAPEQAGQAVPGVGFGPHPAQQRHVHRGGVHVTKSRLAQALHGAEYEHRWQPAVVRVPAASDTSIQRQPGCAAPCHPLPQS